MQESGIFKTAVKLPAHERAAYLDKACGSNAALRLEVEGLLRAHDQPGEFMHRPPIADMTTTFGPGPERPGMRIGPYKLLQFLGEGGMGTVFLAEQTQPIRRMVALKIVKPGMDSSQVLARFEAERQALALMDHPNIAKVFDAGMTGEPGASATGVLPSPVADAPGSERPYFVMELVKGVPITEFCDKNKLDTRQRLELFIPICNAIQHAHMKGIIHRDIKPSNVLIALYDGKPVPKVIDFGVAKAVAEPLTQRTLFTQLGQIVGTFEYMSPEQATLNQLDIDTRSDIYSLGVLLYELLTGVTPLDKDKLRRLALDQMLRTIREEEPLRPSARLSSAAGALATAAAYRGSDSQKLIGVLRGELDWIVMKCLEKERDRRFVTASSLGQDVERYLRDEPVTACPPSWGYRVRKAYRKNRTAITVATLCLLLLIAGIVATSWQAIRATVAEQNATQERNAAVVSEEKAQESARLAEASAAKAKAAQAELRRGLYLSNSGLIQTAWDANNTGRVLELLDQARPRPDEEDLRGFEWYYWRRLCHADLGTVRLFYPHGHATPYNLVFSPDGRYVAGRNPAAGITVWEAATAKPLAAFPEATINVLPTFSPDSKRLASWVVTPPAPGEPASAARMVIKVYEVSTGKELVAVQNAQRKLLAPPSMRNSRLPMYQFRLSFSGDGKRIAALRLAKLAAVWDAEDGRELLAIDWPEGEGGGLWVAAAPTFSPDGRELAVTAFHIGNGGKTEAPSLRLFDAATGKERLQIPMPVTAGHIVYHPDSKRIAVSLMRAPAATGDEAPSSVAIWETVTGKRLVLMPLGKGLELSGVTFSTDGKFLAGWNHREPVVYLWDADTGKPLASVKGLSSLIQDAVFSADGRRLHVAQQDGAANMWDVGPPAPLVAPAKGMKARDGLPTVLAIGYAGAELRLAVEDRIGERGRDRKPGVIGVLGPDGREYQRLDLPGPLSVIGGDVAFSPDGTRLATVSIAPVAQNADGQGPAKPFPPAPPNLFPCPATVQVWDLNTGREIWSASALQADLPRLAWQGNRIAVTALEDKGDRKARLVVLDATTGKEERRVDCPTRVIGAVLSRDGARLAAYFDMLSSGRVMIWDVLTGELLRTFANIPRTLSVELAFSPDGKRLAFAHNPQRTLDAQPAAVTVWDVGTGEKLLTLRGEAESVHSLCFSTDGKRLVSAGERKPDYGEVKVWDVTGGREVLTLSAEPGLGHVHFSPDGHRLLGARRDRAGQWLQTWDATPLTPEVDGRARLLALAAELPAKAEVIERLRTIPELSDAARAAALKQADTILHDDAFRLNSESWNVVNRPGRKLEEYLRALRWAERAAVLAPENAMVLDTLGAAQYRTGGYKEALETLTRCAELNKNKDPSDSAFLALTHQRLGNADKAREYFELLRKQARPADRDLLGEVETQLHPFGP
jgi:serine/threonine protein kinase/WD40 repeat protein